MTHRRHDRPLEVWVGEESLLPVPPSHPLVMHETPLEESSELSFWKLWRDVLPQFVTVRRFSRLGEAGRLVVIPHMLWDYHRSGRMRQMVRFKERVLRSGRVPVLYATTYEYRRRSGEILLNTARYLRSRDGGEANVATPAWLFDVGDATPLARPDVPTVGFVGATAYPSRTHNLMKRLPLPWSVIRLLSSSAEVNAMLPQTARFRVASDVREAALRAARKSEEIVTSIVARDRQYFAHSHESRSQARQEYVLNIRDNAYTLCIRGTENYSYRLFEVMSAGRLPVIIDTNMQLPSLDGFGDWNEFSVFVPVRAIASVGERVRRFHDALTAEGFEHACRRAREAFDYLLPHRFFPRLLASRLFEQPVD